MNAKVHPLRLSIFLLACGTLFAGTISPEDAKNHIGQTVTLSGQVEESHAAVADLTGSYIWKQMKIGGGGWVVGMNISPTEKDLIYIRTDVSGAYRWSAATSSWKPVVSASSMPADSVAYGKYSGVDSLVSAPKDPNIAYMAFAGDPWNLIAGQVYKSTNRGDTWVATNFRENTHVKMLPNGEGRQEGERLGIDPVNSDVVYFASIQDGLWATEDGGNKWAKVAAIPSGTTPHGVNTVVFDKGGGTLKSATGGDKTKVIYITVDQGGVFKTTDAGVTWTKISDAAAGDVGKPRDAAIGPDRTYYVAYDNDKGALGALWKYSPSGTWTNITPLPPDGGKDKSYWAVALDPADAHHVVAMLNGGKLFVSNDQGATWSVHAFHLNSPNIQWLGHQQNYWLSVGQLAFDPFIPGKLWFAEGFGVWTTQNLITPEINWQAASEGIEEVCGNDVISPPDGQPVAAMWDLGAFYFSDPDAYTAVRSQPNFMAGWALDWCPADPKFIVGVFRNNLGFPPHPNSTGYSTDGGQTWSRFPSVEKNTIPVELEYGTIAVSANSTDHIVWCPAKLKLPYYTTNKGTTWQQSSFGGPIETGFNSFPMALKPLCADRVLPDTFYFYRPLDGGIYCSTDGGAHFTKMGSTVANRYNAFLKSTPGHAKNLWFAEGTGGGVWHSTNGGVTWNKLPGIQVAYNIGLGKSEKDGGYPTIFVAGTVDGQMGIYRSTDTGKTWDKIGGYPLGIFDFIDAMDGDKNTFGEVYIGFSGSGFAYGAVTKKP